MQITASIVTYKNKKEMLDAAVNSFLNTDLDIFLYIIDNSPDDRIATWYSDSRISYIHNKANIGFGAGHNIIMRDLVKMGRYHLVLNPDVRFGKGTLEALYAFMEKNCDVGNCMPKVFYPNGDLQYICKLLPTPFDWFIRRFIPDRKIKDKINWRFEMRFSGYDHIMNVPYLSGCFMFLRKDVIREIGVFDEGIFMYCEDTDLNRRIFCKYRTVFFPEVSIVHEFGRGSLQSAKLFWIHLKATVYYFNKWGWFFDDERKEINERIVKQY